MNEIRKAELEVLEAADKWFRKTLQKDVELGKEEKAIYEAVFNLNQLKKQEVPLILDLKHAFIPPPPKKPNISPSQIPTIPVGPIELKKTLDTDEDFDKSK